MLSQFELNPLLGIEARIQNRIAKFLSLKTKIIQLKQHPTISISTKANQLYNKQVRLEAELSEVLKKIELLKQGAWTFSDIANLGIFYAKMEDQIKDVGKLQDKSGMIFTVDSPKPEEGIPFIKWLTIGGIALAFLVFVRR